MTMYSYTHQEQLVRSMIAGQYDCIANCLARDLLCGRSPSMLSVVRPNILVGTASALLGLDFSALTLTGGGY